MRSRSEIEERLEDLKKRMLSDSFAPELREIITTAINAPLMDFKDVWIQILDHDKISPAEVDLTININRQIDRINTLRWILGENLIKCRRSKKRLLGEKWKN